jgi:hypothetical protein
VAVRENNLFRTAPTWYERQNFNTGIESAIFKTTSVHKTQFQKTKNKACKQAISFTLVLFSAKHNWQVSNFLTIIFD